MKIRRGEVKDLHKLGRLWREMVVETENVREPNVNFWKSMTAQHMMHNKEYECLVIENGQTIIGFVDFFMTVEPALNKIIAVARHMYVKPEYRRTRSGYSLFKQLIEHVRVKGGEFLSAEVKDYNRWERHGFKVDRYIVRMGVGA